MIDVEEFERKGVELTEKDRALFMVRPTLAYAVRSIEEGNFSSASYLMEKSAQLAEKADVNISDILSYLLSEISNAEQQYVPSTDFSYAKSTI